MSRIARIVGASFFLIFGIALVGFLTYRFVRIGSLAPPEFWLGGILTAIFGVLSMRRELRVPDAPPN